MCEARRVEAEKDDCQWICCAVTALRQGAQAGGDMHQAGPAVLPRYAGWQGRSRIA